MAIKSGIFNSVGGDRKYDATNFAEYFASFVGNGIFPQPSNGLKVNASNNMNITVQAGKAWINGYFMVNDSDYTLTLDNADGILNRIDRIVVRYDVIDRELRLQIKKGVLASSPVAPVIQRDANAYELALADIYIAVGAITILQGNITDLRLNADYCGVVDSLIAGNVNLLSDRIDELFATKFDKTADGKDITVSFTEASTESDIISGEKLSIMFGKILKKFKNIISGTTTVGKAATATTLQTARTINGVSFNGSANITIADSTKAPISHAVNANTYGLGNASLFGHVKLSDATDSTSNASAGIGATPMAVKAINDKLKYTVATITSSGNWTVPAGVTEVDIITIDGGGGGARGNNGYSNYPQYNFQNGEMRGGNGGQGGSSGILKNGKVKVVSGEVLSIIIGAGAAGGTTSTPTIGGVTTVANYSNYLSNSKSVVGGNGGIGDKYTPTDGITLRDDAAVGFDGDSHTFSFGTAYINLFSGGGGGGGRRPTGAARKAGGTSAGGGNGGQGGTYNTSGLNGANATVYGAGGGGSGGAGSPPQAASNTSNTCENTSVGGAGKSGVVYIGYYGY